MFLINIGEITVVFSLLLTKSIVDVIGAGDDYRIPSRGHRRYHNAYKVHKI